MQLSVLSAECGCPKSGACVYRNFANAPAKKLDGDDVRRSEDEKPLQVLSYRMTVKQLFVAEEHLGGPKKSNLRLARLSDVRTWRREGQEQTQPEHATPKARARQRGGASSSFW
jgi:hypothetical protein